MKTIVKIEEIALFLFSIFLFVQTGFTWWWFPVLLFIPDVSMVGYIFNSKIGAYIYNFFHHRGVALVLYGFGLWLNADIILLMGIILFAHASMDRIFGYGLKYTDSFFNTHLGKIGQNHS